MKSKPVFLGNTMQRLLQLLENYEMPKVDTRRTRAGISIPRPPRVSTGEMNLWPLDFGGGIYHRTCSSSVSQ